VEQRLVSFNTTEVHCDGQQLAALILQVLFGLGLKATDIVGGARDSCSTNGRACDVAVSGSRAK